MLVRKNENNNIIKACKYDDGMYDTHMPIIIQAYSRALYVEKSLTGNKCCARQKNEEKIIIED